MATELRRHRELSETIFGLILDERISPEDVDGKMLVYPYSRALEDVPGSNRAKLSLDYGSDAISAASKAAQRVNGEPVEHWLHELITTYRDNKIINVMGRNEKKLSKGEAVDWDELRGHIEERVADQSFEPLAWEDIKDEFDHEWIWNGWVPDGETTILVGPQGAGKSALALFLADCVANGTQLPDGTHAPKECGVLWVETEGRQGENIRRARAWGVDGRNIYSPSRDIRRVLNLTEPDDKALIRAHAMRPEVGLVVIDSLGGSLMNENEASAKGVLQSLSVMAQETNTAFIIIHHLRKPSGRDKNPTPTLDMVRGHSGITQFAPSVIAIEYAGQEMPRFLYHLKNNLVEAPDSLSFSIGPWGPVFNEDTIDQVKRAITDECLEWLKDLLRPGPMPTIEIMVQGRRAGYTRDVMKRAIHHPAIKSERIDGQTCLTL